MQSLEMGLSYNDLLAFCCVYISSVYDDLQVLATQYFEKKRLERIFYSRLEHFHLGMLK